MLFISRNSLDAWVMGRFYSLFFVFGFNCFIVSISNFKPIASSLRQRPGFVYANVSRKETFLHM